MKRAFYFFKQTIQKNRLAHLYLIVGPKGSGKSQLVDDVAYLILNQDKPESPHLKLLIKERKVQNMIVIEPDGLSIKKEQILYLQSEFSKTALVSGPRIYVIKGIEKISIAAANSLLKFMEEPQSHTVFGFLLAEDKENVLRTIQSRSQILTLKSIDELDMEQELIQLGVDERVAILAPYVTKNIEEATLLAEDPNFTDLIAMLEEMANLWDRKDISYPIYFGDKARFLTQNREFFMHFLELLLLYFLDFVHYRTHQPITYKFLREVILVQSDKMQVSEVNDLIEQIQTVLQQQSYYINLELALDHLLYILEKKR
ncbi:MAG: AAA family ATPase [Acholeplasmataceae bacterium]|jgi:DNA polymerase-3 subunit delta'|nr:AAA family ATPase [Acholeplasmataceae bacterium]